MQAGEEYRSQGKRGAQDPKKKKKRESKTGTNTSNLKKKKKKKKTHVGIIPFK